MTTLGPDVVLRRADVVEDAVFDDGTVVFDAERVRSVLLNSSAAIVWDVVDGARTVDQVVAATAEAYAVNAADVRADVEGVLHQLLDAGLLDVVPHTVDGTA